jgi:hypothetical protein
MVWKAVVFNHIYLSDDRKNAIRWAKILGISPRRFHFVERKKGPKKERGYRRFILRPIGDLKKS